MSQESKPKTDEMRKEYDIRGGVRGKYYERYKTLTRVTNADRIVSWLEKHPEGADDDELSTMLGIRPRQQVNSICRANRLISRIPDPVTGKIRNYLLEQRQEIADPKTDQDLTAPRIAETPPLFQVDTPPQQPEMRLVLELFSSTERVKDSVVDLYYHLHGGQRQRFGWWMVNFLEGENAIGPDDKNSIELVCAMRNLMAHAPEYPGPPDGTLHWMLQITNEISSKLRWLIDQAQ